MMYNIDLKNHRNQLQSLNNLQQGNVKSDFIYLSQS